MLLLFWPFGAVLAEGAGVCEPEAVGVLMIVTNEAEGGRRYRC